MTQLETPVLLLDLRDVIDENIRSSTNTRLVLDTSGGDAVEILGSDGQTDDEIGELGAVLLDGGFDGGDLVGHGLLAGGGPDSEQELGVGRDGGRDGGDGV
jgi:hypothetical protein